MWPFGNQYDVWVVDYKVIIKENLTYNRSWVVFWAFIILGCTSLAVFAQPEGETSTEGGLFIIIVELGLFAALFFTRRPNGIIEIDNDAKTILVRDKYNIDRANVTAIKISELRSSNGYIYDYLSLVCDWEEETSIYKIVQTGLRGKEIKRIAGVIAETLKLTLIIENQETTNWGERKKAVTVF